MRTLVAVVFMIVLSAPVGVASDAGGLPQRQPGKWKLSTEMDEGRGAIKQALTMCITAEMEKATADKAVSEHRSNCSRYDVKNDGETTVVEAECAYAVDRVISRTEMSGDFKKAFEVKIVTTTLTQPPGGNALTRERKITQVGEHLGSDCGDIQPGEAVADDGSRVMVQ